VSGYNKLCLISYNGRNVSINFRWFKQCLRTRVECIQPIRFNIPRPSQFLPRDLIGKAAGTKGLPASRASNVPFIEKPAAAAAAAVCSSN